MFSFFASENMNQENRTEYLKKKEYVHALILSCKNAIVCLFLIFFILLFIILFIFFVAIFYVKNGFSNELFGPVLLFYYCLQLFVPFFIGNAPKKMSERNEIYERRQASKKLKLFFLQNNS